MGDSESRDGNLGEYSDNEDEDEDENEIFVRELKMAQRTLCNQFHIDSEVEIDIAQPDGTPFLSRALKAVLIKKKGFDPALLPPWISGNKHDDDDLLPGSRNRNRKSESSISSSTSSCSSSLGPEAEIGMVTE